MTQETKKKRVFLCYDCKEEKKRTTAIARCPDCKLWHCAEHLNHFTGRCEWCDELKARDYL